MVGIDDSVGEGAPTPGVGNNGSITGDKVGGENEGASCKNAGAADIVENCTCIWDVKAGEEKEPMKTVNIAKNIEQKEAINLLWNQHTYD